MAAHHVALPVLILAVALLAPSGHVAGEPWSVCGDSGEYDDKSEFQANLNLVAAALLKNASASHDLFATAEAGDVPEKVTALALCRGDANSRSCSSCLVNAFANLPNVCPGSKDAIIYYDTCMLRYSDVQLLSADDSGPLDVDLIMTVRNAANATSEPGRYQRVVATLMNATADYAAYNSTRRYASGAVDLDREFPKVYSLAQCIPDLTPGRCRRCLAQIIAQLPVQLTDSIGGRLLGPRCSFRYEIKPFINGPVIVQLAATSASSGALAPAVVPTAPAAATAEGIRRSEAGIYAGIACSVVFLLVLSVFTFIRFKRKIKTAEDDNPFKKIAKAFILDLLVLQEATEIFSEENKLGEGGYGIVYKGILPDGQEIAVKKLLGATEHGLHQLRNEVLLLAQLQHKNLVRLQGFCSHRGDTLLVYEYIKNGSLDNFLFDTSVENTLNWGQQYNIILGIAKGILYLHEESSPRIIHRDLKANNILLDEEMNPKIVEFGLARVLQEGHTQTQTTRAARTLGYMSPEYAIHGILSPKIDIFGFGVLILEIITKRRNCSSDHGDAMNLLSDVWNYWTKGTISQMMDESLNEYPRSQVLRCIHIGLLCVQPDPDDRPRISTIIFMLTRDIIELQPPVQPAFFFGAESPSPGSPRYGQRHYMHGRSDLVLENDESINGITITEPYPR